jgi:hypothetical protein
MVEEPQDVVLAPSSQSKPVGQLVAADRGAKTVTDSKVKSEHLVQRRTYAGHTGHLGVRLNLVPRDGERRQ